MRITRMSTRLALVLAAAALIPLVTFGTWAFLSLQAETRRSVIDANLALVTREAGDLARELSRDTNIVAALAGDVLNTMGDEPAQWRVLDNYLMRFPTFRGLTVLNERGLVVAGRDGRSTAAHGVADGSQPCRPSAVRQPHAVVA